MQTTNSHCILVHNHPSRQLATIFIQSNRLLSPGKDIPNRASHSLLELKIELRNIPHGFCNPKTDVKGTLTYRTGYTRYRITYSLNIAVSAQWSLFFLLKKGLVSL